MTAKSRAKELLKKYGSNAEALRVVNDILIPLQYFKQPDNYGFDWIKYYQAVRFEIEMKMPTQ